MSKLLGNSEATRVLLRLTIELNRESLSLCYMQILSEELHADYVALYEITNSDGVDRSGIPDFNIISTTSPECISESEKECNDRLASVIACSKKNNTHTCIDDYQNTQRLVLPLRSTTGITGYLLLERAPLSSEEIDLLFDVSTIYSNQHRLLTQCRSDPLTGLLNRQAFNEKLNQLTASYKQDSNRRLHGIEETQYLALFDIDHFKIINDTFGHVYGDEVLLLFAQIMQKSFRSCDLLFRYGGEEFAVVLSNIHEDELILILERFRLKVQEYNFPQVENVTVSIGATILQHGNAYAYSIEKADKALYHAKNSGRNQTYYYEELVASGAIEKVHIRTGDVDLF